MKQDLEKFVERYPTYIEALEMLEQKDQRIAELEKDLEFTTKTANELIEIKHKLEQELAELKEKYNKASEKLKNITEEVENNFVHGQDYEKLKQELAELKEKAIVPRFKFDEECVVIMFGSYHFHRFIAQVKDDLCLTQPYNDTEEWYYVKPEMVFKTLEEAQAKLKEIQGNE